MKPTVAALLFLALSLPAHAEETFGAVTAIYYEASRGILVQWTPRSAAAARWADVDLGGRKVLARVPDGMRIAPGDRIAVLLGTPKSMPLAQALPTTTVSRAIAPQHGASVGR